MYNYRILQPVRNTIFYILGYHVSAGKFSKDIVGGDANKSRGFRQNKILY